MNEESIKKIPTRLQFFPVMMFAVIMGLAGLSIVYQRAHELLGFPSFLASAFSYFTIGLFFIILFTYIIKFFKYKEEVRAEFAHPIRINFFASISISFVLISILFKSINTDISYILFLIGAILHLFLTFYTLSFWISKSLEMQHSNPAWFIPIVGNLIVPVGGVSYFPSSILMFYFSIGIFFWIIMLSIILNRIIFHKAFAAKFIPTLFIFIAPPSVGFLAYFKLTNDIDFFALVLFNIALFFTFLLFFMYKNFLNIKFFISWWAFTFPLATITLATLLILEQTKESFYIYLAYIFIFILSVVVSIVLYNTILHMFKKEICIME